MSVEDRKELAHTSMSPKWFRASVCCREPAFVHASVCVRDIFFSVFFLPEHKAASLWEFASVWRSLCSGWSVTVSVYYSAKNKPFVSGKSSGGVEREDNLYQRDPTLITLQEVQWQQALSRELQDASDIHIYTQVHHITRVPWMSPMHSTCFLQSCLCCFTSLGLKCHKCRVCAVIAFSLSSNTSRRRLVICNNCRNCQWFLPICCVCTS